MFDPFELIFVQRGILEIAALSIAAGLIGTWIVLRGLAFYAHAVGTASFPGLVLADGLGFSAHLGAGGHARSASPDRSAGWRDATAAATTASRRSCSSARWRSA